MKFQIRSMLEGNERITFFARMVNDKFINEFKTPRECYQITATTNLEMCIEESARYCKFHGISITAVESELLALVDEGWVDAEMLEQTMMRWADFFGYRYFSKEQREDLLA